MIFKEISEEERFNTNLRTIANEFEFSTQKTACFNAAAYGIRTFILMDIQQWREPEKVIGKYPSLRRLAEYVASGRELDDIANELKEIYESK